jgi:5'-3' exonuclease
MSSPQGEAVGAVFGFSRDLFYLLEEKRPDYLFCAFDLPGKTFRHEMYEPYKEHRPEMDVDLASQLPLIRQVIEAMGVPALGWSRSRPTTSWPPWPRSATSGEATASWSPATRTAAN